MRETLRWDLSHRNAKATQKRKRPASLTERAFCMLEVLHRQNQAPGKQDQNYPHGAFEPMPHAHEQQPYPAA